MHLGMCILVSCGSWLWKINKQMHGLMWFMGKWDTCRNKQIYGFNVAHDWANEIHAGINKFMVLMWLMIGQWDTCKNRQIYGFNVAHDWAVRYM